MSAARSSRAQATPLTTDATPGPIVVRHTPGRPVIFRLRDRGDRAGRFGRRQHERQAGAARRIDDVEIAAAAGDAEQCGAAGLAKPRDDQIRRLTALVVVSSGLATGPPSCRGPKIAVAGSL